MGLLPTASQIQQRAGEEDVPCRSFQRERVSCAYAVGSMPVTDEVMKFRGVHIISIRRVEANRVEAFV